MSDQTIELPDGVQHGTPEGFAAGCRKEKQCPALLTHGMCCLYAHLRSTTDPRYYRAKVRDPRPAAIAARLGIRPPTPAAAVEEQAVDDAFAAAPEGYRWKKRAARQKEPAPSPAPTETTEPAQPLAEQSQDPEPQEDAATPAIEEETPAATTPAVEDEDMGHPTTTATEEPTVTTTPTYDTELELQCAAAIATPAGRKKVRDWATSQGYEVARTGRIPALFVRSFVIDRFPHLAPALAADPAPTPVNETSNAEQATEPENIDEPALVIEDVDVAIHDQDETAAAPPADEELRPVSILGTRADTFGVDFMANVAINVDPETTKALAADFRPDWAGVTVPEDVRAARATAARLEEDNARLQAELDTATQLLREAADTIQPRLEEIEKGFEAIANGPIDPDDEEGINVASLLVGAATRQLQRTQSSLAFVLRKLDQEKNAHAADDQLHHDLIEKLQEKLRIATALADFRGNLLTDTQRTVTELLTANRDLREAAARPFWRRRR